MSYLSNYITAKTYDASNMCIGIIVAEKHEKIVSELLYGAVTTLEAYGAMTENIHVKTVPGCSELVYGAHQMALRGCYDAVIVLGCVVRGETPHFEFVCDGIFYGISRLNVTNEVPIIDGILTVDTYTQAEERCGLVGNKENKGCECAIDAMKMAKF